MGKPDIFLDSVLLCKAVGIWRLERIPPKAIISDRKSATLFSY